MWSSKSSNTPLDVEL